jgi:hypothetical protein
MVSFGIEGLRPRPWRTFPHPARPSLAKRSRQARTDIALTANSAAIRAFATPSAAASNALARTTSRCAAVWDRATHSNVTR